jgi:hypothetical protein
MFREGGEGGGRGGGGVRGGRTILAKRGRMIGPVPAYRVASLTASEVQAKTCCIRIQPD